MAKIHHLSISHFRGIRKFEQTFSSDFVCLIGRGDSGKTTILDAIAFVLSSTWNVQFYDNDFYNCDTEKPIVIELTMRDVPAALLTEEKFWSHLRTINAATNNVTDDIEAGSEVLITIRLEVKKDLEPKWQVITNREIGSKPIGASDRAKFNAFLVSDYLDRHFSWNKGSPLHTLYVQYAKPDEDESAMIDALRDAKRSIDGAQFSRFDMVVNKVESNAAIFGASIAKTNNTIDFKDIVIKDGKLSMHDREIPFRLKGKGSRRLISMAIQLAIADAGGIILIDEVEQGLEPDRAQNLVSRLKNEHKGQVFITTHSRDVLVELTAKNLFLIRNGASSLTTFDESIQKVLRSNPEAFFARKVLVVEGKTEEGVCRALNIYRVGKKYKSTAVLGVRLAAGQGTTAFDYCRGFVRAGFSVALFCDSDVPGWENDKKELRELGVAVIDWNNGDSIELALTKHLPFNLVMEFFNLAAKIRVAEDGDTDLAVAEEALWQSVKSKYGDGCPKLNEVADTTEIRVAIGMAAKKRGWFKQIDLGQQLGKLIFSEFDSLETNNIVRRQLTALSDWIDT